MKIPISLPTGARILVAGAGGGFDVICALPVVLALKMEGFDVKLASFSFTPLTKLDSTEQPFKSLYAVTGESRLASSDYCPEVQLAKWWKRKFDEEITVWSYATVGVKPLADIFAYLKESLELDAILILDGGVDGLFYGNEYNTGTPSIDAVSIIAGSLVPDIERFYGFTAFGTEGSNQEVRHADALMRVSELIRKNAFLGVAAPTPNGQIAKDYIEALDSIHATMQSTRHSIMAGSLKSALNGEFGMTAFNEKTKLAPVWISALTLIYWFFDLETVARSKPIYEESLTTMNVMQVGDAFDKYRERKGSMPRSDIPI